MLKVENLSVAYGANDALRRVTLEVPDSGVVALLGSNGAGKSTLLRALSNNLKRHRARVTSGAVMFDGTNIVGASMNAIVKRGVVQVPEGRRIFGRLSVDENLRIGGVGRSRREANSTRAHIYELFPRLRERRTQKGLLLSGGEQQMLAIGRALMAAPTLLMLDEPSLGLAPLLVEQVGQVITQVSETGTAVLLIEQNANMALRVSDFAYVLERGEVSHMGPSDELQNTDVVRDLYLGRTGDGSGAQLDVGDGAS